MKLERLVTDDFLKVFRVVCLGGPAGALQAHRTILRNVYDHAGMAFVILAHRGPEKRENAGLLPELLSRVTNMPVSEIREGLRLEPNCVFVMPPRVHMTTAGETFHLGHLSRTSASFENHCL